MDRERKRKLDARQRRQDSLKSADASNQGSKKEVEPTMVGTKVKPFPMKTKKEIPEGTKKGMKPVSKKKRVSKKEK